MIWNIFDKMLNIHNAARMGNVRRVRELLSGNPDLVNARDADGNTALHCAIGYFELGVVEELLARGADVNAQDSRGTTPLHIVAAGVPPDPPPPPKSVSTTATGLAAIHLRIAELLLAHGADVQARTGWGWTALDTAERSNTTYIVDLLRRRHGQEDDRWEEPSAEIHIRCEACGAVNRVAGNRVKEKARCGKCRAPLRR